MLSHKHYNSFLKEMNKYSKEYQHGVPYTKGMIDVKTVGQLLKKYVVEE